MNYTDQQSGIVHYNGEILVVKAGAGSGKTSVLKGYARENPHLRMLYICFNKPIQLEAQASFPKNVECRTGHAIAFARKGKPLNHKLTGNLRMTDVKKFLNTQRWELVTNAISVFNHFLVSADTKITKKNAVGIPMKTARQVEMANAAIDGAKKMWACSIDPKDTFPCVHDVYMKLYCLDQPELHKWFSVILLDEAQDSNPVLSDFVARQQTKKIIVGDDHQQLYRWRGADNALSKFVDFYDADIASITQSFRFGPEIADVASTILAYKREITGCDEFIITGNKTIDDTVHLDLPYRLSNAPYTKLHRTVAGTIQSALDMKTKRIHWVGGLENYNLQEIMDVYYFKNNENDKIKRKKLLVDFNNYIEYEEISEQSGDLEMKRIVRLLEKHGSTLKRDIDLLRRNEEKQELRADLVIATAHRAKGLEWDTVRLASDFTDLLDDDLDMSEETVGDELNLLYVACTRAIRDLEPNSVVFGIIAHMKKIIHKGENPPAYKKYAPLMRLKGNPSAEKQRVELGD
jgi:hypothetical protein